MTTRQQKEALNYFGTHAEDWKDKAISADRRKFNVIERRNNYVVDVIKGRAATESVLDVGCGTGDLVCEIARMGIAATGNDFADDMIAVARATAAKEGLDKAAFDCSSIFDFDLAKRQYDVVAANGFIEYISLDELDRFFELAYQALNPGGSFVVGSRNRLLNLFTINAFTLEEIENGAMYLLMQEAIALALGADIAALADLETAPLQDPHQQHARTTEIDVSTRFQFTPAQLIQKLLDRGFSITELYPIHIHGVPPAFKDQHPETHIMISSLLQNFGGDNPSLVPSASTFMLHAQKGA